MKYLILAASIFGLDTWIKERREADQKPQVFAHGYIKIVTSHNEGACFNLGKQKPLLIRICSVILSIALTFLFIATLTTCGRKWMKLGLSFLLGGAFSNTYDRIRRGYVVDYLNFPKMPGKSREIVYNISDFFILLGSLTVVLKGDW